MIGRAGAMLDRSVTCVENGATFIKKRSSKVERQVQESRPLTEEEKLTMA